MPDFDTAFGEGMSCGRRIRRVHRLAGHPPFRRPDDRSAPGRVRGRDRDRAPTDPRGGPGYVNLIAAAGNETTTRLIGWTGKVLAEHPDQRRQLVEDRSLVPNAIEELLRYESPSPVQARYVTRDVEHHGQPVPAGSAILLLTASAQPRRAQVPRRRPVRHPPQDRPPPGLRLRHPLLPGIGAGPARGPHRPGRGPPAVPDLGGRLGPRRPGPDVDGPGLGEAPRRHLLSCTTRRHGSTRPTSREDVHPMRTVVVGASSGLGRSIAIGLGQRGATVALLARRQDRLVDAAEEAGPDSLAIVCDVTDDLVVPGGHRGGGRGAGRDRRPRLRHRRRTPRPDRRHRRRHLAAAPSTPMWWARP